MPKSKLLEVIEVSAKTLSIRVNDEDYRFLSVLAFDTSDHDMMPGAQGIQSCLPVHVASLFSYEYCQNLTTENTEKILDINML